MVCGCQCVFQLAVSFQCEVFSGVWLGVGKLWEAVWFSCGGRAGILSFFLPLSLAVLPYTADCRVRHGGKLVGVRVRMCGHVFPFSLPYPLLSYL
jgi:hypothetical protein